MLRPEVEAMALQLSARGVDVETHLLRSQVHAFPVLADAMPESREALKLAADFARRAVGEPEQHHVKDADQHVETVVGELVPDDVSEDEVIDVELETGSDDRKRWFFQAS
jgi:triacylglycerol lipase